MLLHNFFRCCDSYFYCNINCAISPPPYIITYLLIFRRTEPNNACETMIFLNRWNKRQKKSNWNQRKYKNYIIIFKESTTLQKIYFNVLTLSLNIIMEDNFCSLLEGKKERERILPSCFVLRAFEVTDSRGKAGERFHGWVRDRMEQRDI